MDYITDKILLNQEVERKKDIFVVEDSIIIPDVKPDILSIVNTSNNLYVYKKELNNSKVKIDGGIQLDTIYTADDEMNSINVLHSTLDFSKVLEFNLKEFEKSTFSCALNVKNIDSKIINGRKIGIKATIEYEIFIYSNKEIEYISQIDNCDVQKIGKTINISLLKNSGETQCRAKETISVEDNITDILSYSISVKNKEQKVSYNKILSKADCVIDFIYINEKNQIQSSQEIIPVMGFIDMPGVTDEELSIINYETRNICIKPDSVTNNTILVDIEFEIKCDLYEKKSMNIIQDLYSPEEEITLYQEEVSFAQNRNIIKSRYDINDKINSSEAKDNKIYITNISKNNISQKISGEYIYYNGNINVDFLFESNNTNRLEQRSQSLEFSHNVKIEGKIDDIVINSDFEIDNVESKAIQSGEQNLNMGITIYSDVYSKTKVNLINNVKVEKSEETKRKSSLVIYYVKEGDTLWNIAKKFKTTTEEIIEVNEIENENKLKIGEQLFIPKHVCKSTY